MMIAERTRDWYVADFETTGLNEYEETGRTRIWLYSICNSNSVIVEDGNNIDDFMKWCEKHPQSVVYFHNLKFDGTFILSWLLENNFPIEDKLLTHSKRGFSTLIGDMGEFYQIKVNFAPNKQITFYDSLKLIPLTVKKIAEAFELPIQKEVIDYNNYDITEEKLSYVHNDVRIVAMALKFFREQGHYRMTIGSNAYHSFTDNYADARRMFPRLDKEFIEYWREAYRGGRTQVNPLYENKIVSNVKRYDINSMYPYLMADMPLPYGKPIKMSKAGTCRFELYVVKISFKLKPNHMPTLLKSHSLYNKAGETYYTDSGTILTLKISNIDLELMKRHYDIYVLKYVEIWGFKTIRYVFNDWVREHYKAKSEAKGGLRLVYKLILNSLYGKYGSRPTGRNKIPFLEDGILTYKLSEEHDMGIYYLPVAIAITSWAHKMIDDAIVETGYENFVYCDTDSVHTLGSIPEEWIDNKELGKFKFEGLEEIAKYVRQKTYIYKQDGKWELTCAGMPQGVKDYLIRENGDDVINTFTIGLHVDLDSPNMEYKDMKLRPKQVAGGTILLPVPFSLR